MSIGNAVFPVLTSFQGNLGLYFKDLTDGETLEINGNRVFSAASVIKIPLILTLMEKIKAGTMNLTQKIPIEDTNRVGGTGIIQNLNHEYVPTVAELITLAICVSDNIATNQIIDLVGGPDTVNLFCQKNGLLQTKLQRKMLDQEARKAGKDNWTAATEIGMLLETITHAIFGNQEETKKIFMPLFKGMIVQQCRNKIPSRIPAADYYMLKDDFLPPEGEVTVANKTGDLGATQNDVAICILPDARIYVLSLFTDGNKVAGDGISFIAQVSQAVYEYMKSKK